MAENYVYSPFDEVLGQFSELFKQVFSQITELSEKRKLKKSANAFIDLVIDESIKRDVGTVTNNIIKSMPEGVWNIETINLVETKLKLIFDNDFITMLKNNPQFDIKDPIKKSNFLKIVLSQMLDGQIMGFNMVRKQISRESLREKDKLNIRLGREIIDTLNLINEKSKNILKEMKKTKDITADDFSQKIKRYWTAYTLLFFRIIDIIISYNEDKDIALKKMSYLGIERVRIGSYY